MKLFSKVLTFGVAAAFLTACGSPVANTNTASNANSNRAVVVNANNNGSTMGNAVNSVTNTVSNAAAAITTDSPDDFMQTAAHGGLAEVEMGKLAAQKAADPEVKKFGQQMVTDHGKANTELKALAGKKNVALPTDLGSHQGDLDDLKGLSGAEFDRAYVESMVSAHESDVKAFEAQANSSSDPEVKAFAAKTLPVLKKHLETIQSINARINK